jgi:hypothetical protein
MGYITTNRKSVEQKMPIFIGFLANNRNQSEATGNGLARIAHPGYKNPT